MNEHGGGRRLAGSAALILLAGVTLAGARTAWADCEAQPTKAKWCNGATIPWSFGQGLSGSVSGAALTIKLTISQAMSDLNYVFAKSKVPIGLSGPAGTPGTGITFTYGATSLGVGSCTTTRTYAKTYYSFSYNSGNAIGNMTKAQIDFNNQFSGWTSALALTVTYHEMGHALGLDHVYAVPIGNCPSTAGADPLMSESLPCSASPGLDALFEKGIRCLYGPGGVALHGVSFSVTGSGGTQTLRSRCSGTASCASSPGAISTQGALTYDLALSENGGPFVSFATLEEGDWIDNGYEHAFTQAYTNARVRLEVRDGATVVAAPVSDPIDIPAPVTAVEPSARRIDFVARPNPFRGTVQFRLEAALAGRVRVSVLDAAGRRVRALHEGLLAAGPHEFTWDGRDDGGRLVSPGVYYAEAFTPAARSTRPIVRLP